MFGARLEIVRILGIPVRVDASWLLLAALISWTLAAGVFPKELPGQDTAVYWVMGGSAALGLLLSILLHELSHAVVAKRFGIPIGGITLFIFGGVAEMEAEPPNAKAELYMAIAGPIASVVIGLLCWLAVASGVAWPGPVATVVGYLALINLVLAGFNLLPAFPLDGGRVFRAALWGHWRDFGRATRLAARFGLWAGAGLMGLGAAFFLLWGSVIGGIWWFVIGLFLRGAAQSELLRLEMSGVMTGHKVGDFMTRDPVTVPAATSLAELVSEYVYRHHFGTYPVIDGDRAVGLVGLKHVRGVHEAEWPGTTVGEVMTPLRPEMSVLSDMPAMEALQRLQKSREKRLVVTEQGRVVGILTLADLMTVVGLMLELHGLGRDG